ncbi:MAG: C1 family peptidase [Treponema sp.]|jgi:hypothetical protein|nr:C1 family peptidase [Treponema sp.]
MKRYFFCWLIMAACSLAAAQQRPRSAILDEALYNSLPIKAGTLTRGYSTLPASASLKNYAPFPGDQGSYSTCTAWAAAYAARTIAESVAVKRLDRTLTSGNVFSPAFVYKNISDDPACQKGTAIVWALDLIKNQGVPRRIGAELAADFKSVQTAMYRDSRKYPIAGYAALFRYRRGETADPAVKTQTVKKSLSEGKPVIIGMNTPASFDTAKSPWTPKENPQVNHGGHAMCVTGYDDSKYGGAFEVQNSWGDDWGDKGFIWIPYQVFGQFVYEAYEMIEDLASYKDAAFYSGFVDIETDKSKAGMPVQFTREGYYRTVNSYPSGTRFRFIMGNNHPAYVYAFTADSLTSKTNLIFPLAELNESPALDYTESKVAWPGENEWIELDDIPGTDYLVVLYSKRELDINAVRTRFERLRGGFADRVSQAVGSDYTPSSYVRYDPGRIRFSGTLMNSKAVLGLLLAIDHKAGD